MTRTTSNPDADLDRTLAGRALAITIGAAITAVIVLGALSADGSDATGWVDVAIGAAVLAVGSVLAGRSLSVEPTIRPVLAAILVPLLVAVPAFFVAAGLSGSVDALPTALAVAVAIYGLQMIPMLIVQRWRSRRVARA